MFTNSKLIVLLLFVCNYLGIDSIYIPVENFIKASDENQVGSPQRKNSPTWTFHEGTMCTAWAGYEDKQGNGEAPGMSDWRILYNP